MPAFTIRPVTLAQTRALRQAVLRPHESLQEMAAHEPPGAFAVGAYEGEALVAVGLVGPDGVAGEWRVRGMATDPRVRGRGAGSAVLAALLARAGAEGAQRIWCNARTPSRSLYERAGMRAVSEEFEIPPIGPHFVMELRTAPEPPPTDS
jgi:GNAT superfamily N-acetyltransferase